MARKDAIEVEGTVVELRPPRARAYFGKNALTLHSYLARRQSYARDFPLRFVEGADHFPPEMTARAIGPAFLIRSATSFYESTTISKKTL